MAVSPDILPVPAEYQTFPFRVKWNGRYVAGFTGASPLPQKLKILDRQRSGYPPHALGPEGQGTCFFISLDEGVTFDHGFGQWLSMVRCYGPATGKGSLLPEYKRPFAIEVCDEAGRVTAEYHLVHGWVDEYRAVPGPDCDSSEIHIEHLRLGFERWERNPPEEEGDLRG